MRSTPWLVGLSVVAACGAPAATDVDPFAGCGTTSVCQTPYYEYPPDKLDLLLVIDDSSAMGEEQALVIAEIPRFLQQLVSGHPDASGLADFTPVRSIHIGIVSTDMGVGDVTGLARCDPGFGDDGLMQIRAAHPAAGCTSDYSGVYPGNVFDFTSGGPTSVTAFAHDVSCVAGLGTAGCGFPFVLEAPLKAISLVPSPTGDSPVAWTRPGYRPPTFYAGTFGHGGDPATNGAFLRPDSVLAVVVVSDHDDCSTDNPQIFSPENPAYSAVDLGLRCHTFASDLFPIERYSDGFLGLRANPGLLVYGVIAGVPTSLAGADASVILADPQMQEQVDPADPTQLLPACSSTHGTASPANRLTELARLLGAAGARTTVQSICGADLAPAFDALVQPIAQGLGIPGCFEADLPHRPDGSIDCRYEITMQSGMHCADVGLARSGATTSFGMVFDVCELPQLSRDRVGTDVGWFEDDGTFGAFSMLPAGCRRRISYSRWTDQTGFLVCP